MKESIILHTIIILIMWATTLLYSETTTMIVAHSTVMNTCNIVHSIIIVLCSMLARTLAVANIQTL